jgi:hypothetical protein
VEAWSSPVPTTEFVRASQYQEELSQEDTNEKLLPLSPHLYVLAGPGLTMTDWFVGKVGGLNLRVVFVFMSMVTKNVSFSAYPYGHAAQIALGPRRIVSKTAMRWLIFFMVSTVRTRAHRPEAQSLCAGNDRKKTTIDESEDGAERR